MITTAIVMAALGIVCFGLLDPLTLRQQSVLFASALYGYLFIRHRLPAPAPKRVEQPTGAPSSAFVPPKPPDLANVPGAPAQTAAPGGASIQKKAAGNLSFYQAEANVINKQLAKVYKLNCAIDWKHPGRSIIMGYGFINYVLTQTGPLRFDDLRKIEDDLGREINTLHRHFRYGDVNVIAVNSQPIVLQVTRAKPQRLHWSERKWAGQPMQTVLGHYWQGAKRHDLVLDMAGSDSEYINGAFFGQPGSGKSTALHIALVGLLESTPPERLEVYCIDLKSNTFRQYRHLPHVRAVTGDIDEAIGILEAFAKWCTVDGKPEDGKYRLLIIDECQMLLTHLEHGGYILSLLARILEAGREPGIRVWTATQNPDALSYPSRLKPKTHYMAAGLIKNDDYLRRQLSIYGASKLQGKGEMIFTGPYGDCRLTTFWLTDEDRAAAIGGLVRKWCGAGAEPVRTGAFGGAQVVRGGALGGAGVVRTAGAEPVPVHSTQNGVSIEFPIKPARPLTDDEAEVVRQLATMERFFYRGELSLNQLVEHVYGAKRSDRLVWIREALEQ